MECPNAEYSGDVKITVTVPMYTRKGHGADLCSAVSRATQPKAGVSGICVPSFSCEGRRLCCDERAVLGREGASVVSMISRREFSITRESLVKIAYFTCEQGCAKYIFCRTKYPLFYFEYLRGRRRVPDHLPPPQAPYKILYNSILY